MDNDLSFTEIRYVRDYKCQVSVGELYRWILAKLTDKEIKRALHKYRDLMPRQSDWNRKLTQATNMPELGFRYLYRCGQIDESNHRTMQKMLKYIDRQDVLPYFDTILYNTNFSNASMDTLKSVLLDPVDNYLMQNDMDCDSFVHPDSAFEILQCQPVESMRITRSRSKRKSTDDYAPKCLTMIKKARRSSVGSNCTSPTVSLGRNNQVGSSSTSATNSSTPSGQQALFEMAGALNAAVVMAHLPVIGGYNVYQQNRVQGGHPLFLRRIPGLPLPAANPTGPVRPAGGINLNSDSTISASSTNIGGPYSCRLRLRFRLQQPGNVKEILQSVRSDRQGFERQLDVFSQTSGMLRHRESTEVVCDVRFTDLRHLEAFWRDYLTGALKQSIRDILLIDPLVTFSTAPHLIQQAANLVAQAFLPLHPVNQNRPAAPPAAPPPPGQPHPAPGPAAAPGLAPPIPLRRQEMDLHVYIAKSEYETCREQLLKNLTLRSPGLSTAHGDPASNSSGASHCCHGNAARVVGPGLMGHVMGQIGAPHLWYQPLPPQPQL